MLCDGFRRIISVVKIRLWIGEFYTNMLSYS